MAEAVLGVVTALLHKILPLAAEEINRAWGMEEELQNLAQRLKMMQALISDSQSKQLITREAVQLWLKRLRSVALDAEIVLDDFGYEVLRQKLKNRKRDKVRNFFSSSNPISFRLGMANKIKNVSSSLEEVFKEANQLGLRPVELIATSPDLSHTEDRVTDHFVDESEIVGREDDVSKVVNMLVCSDYKKDLPVISIVGMAGQGKTTLAQVVLKDDNVVKYFDESIWVCVSDDFKVDRVLNEMLQSLGGTNDENKSREALVRRLQENLKGKRYLLVLDDIWNEEREKWDCMRKCLLALGSQGSKILATARSHVVASAMQTSGSHQLEVLSDDYSWMLFEKLAFADGGARKTQDLVDIGRRILKRCGGVPLAIRAIGGLLYSMKDQSEWLMIEKSEKWNNTSSIADRVFSALKLSYEHLTSSLKQCFASCSIFPKDAIIEKEDLIQIWMAQGLISHPKEGHLQMEDIGSNYFNILLRNSLLQNPKKDIHNNIISCKMHDLVHDFSLEVSNNYISNTEDDLVISNAAEVVHLTLISRKRKMLKNMEGILPKLRTLYLIGHAALEDFLKKFRYLCVLKVECWDAMELPNSIDEMKHLRYLDISKTCISTLPDSITKLYNLMTLRVSYLKGIPKGFGNLINLRHFHFFRMSDGCLLPGVGQLPNLQTLSIFVVGQDKKSQIEELEHLNNLKGELRIRGLQNVSSYASAAKANLSRKSSIQRLLLAWNRTEDQEDSIEVMEGFQSHSNLKSLTIDGFNGSKLPSWMGTKNHLILLRNLVEISLVNLNNCEQVPSFGDLPNLQVLEMILLRKVKRIGSEFYGRENFESTRRGSCSGEGKAITLFPSLRALVLEELDSLMEWTDAMIPSDSSSIKAFPNLQVLSLAGLPKLAVLLDMLNLTCLQKLLISRCPNLTCSGNLISLTSLQFLSLIGCRCLDPFDIGVNNLKGLSLGAFSVDLDYFPWPFSISNADSVKQSFVYLVSLRLYGWPKIKSLPEQIQHLSALRYLYIWKFDRLEALPDWLGSFQNLELLGVNCCSNLKQLPSAEAMKHLTNLRQLEINECPLLAERCTRGNGVDWPKIAHIPTVTISCLDFLF